MIYTDSNSPLMGAICGDIIGSYYEFHPTKDFNFDLYAGHRFTDDTVCSCAIAKWLMTGNDLTKTLQKYVRAYEGVGCGRNFYEWAFSNNPKPYGSCGNGSAMRVSPVAMFAGSFAECSELAKQSAEITHNHPEGIKGAQAVADAIYLSEEGWSKDDIRTYISRYYHYDLNRSVEDIRKNYKFEVLCQTSVPEAIICYLEGNTYEEVIRNAISLGGDADTQAAIAGSIAAVTMEIPQHILDHCNKFLDADLRNTVNQFHEFLNNKAHS